MHADRLLLLDAGGVLVSTGAMHAAIDVVARRSGRPFDDCWQQWQQLRPDFWCGRTGHADLWRRMGMADDSVEECERVAREAVVALPQAAAVVRLGVRTWVLSNHRSAWLLPALERAGLDAHLERVLVSDAIGTYKPEARAFQIPLELSGIPASNVLFVDDKQHNLDAATEWGLQTLLADSDGAWLTGAREFARGRPSG